MCVSFRLFVSTYIRTKSMRMWVVGCRYRSRQLLVCVCRGWCAPERITESCQESEHMAHRTAAHHRYLCAQQTLTLDTQTPATSAVCNPRTRHRAYTAGPVIHTSQAWPHPGRPRGDVKARHAETLGYFSLLLPIEWILSFMFRKMYTGSMWSDWTARWERGNAINLEWDPSDRVG